ncbi:MAG: hypothetical protein ACE5FN_09390 [Leptospirillia bacterium]
MAAPGDHGKGDENAGHGDTHPLAESGDTPSFHRTGAGLFAFVMAVASLILANNFLRNPGALNAVIPAATLTITICLLLYVANPKRYIWPLRVASGILFLMVAALFTYKALTTTSGFGDRTLLQSIMGFCLIGMPCLSYTLWGNSSGPLEAALDTDTERHEISTGTLVTQLMISLTMLLGLVVFAMQAFI